MKAGADGCEAWAAGAGPDAAAPGIEAGGVAQPANQRRAENAAM
jgi:hypothetical protein